MKSLWQHDEYDRRVIGAPQKGSTFDDLCTIAILAAAILIAVNLGRWLVR
jgi:hypothetical protein